MSDFAVSTMRDLPERLETQANNVENDGWLSAARVMREAASELRLLRVKVATDKHGLDWARVSISDIAPNSPGTEYLAAAYSFVRKHDIKQLEVTLAPNLTLYVSNDGYGNVTSYYS